MDLPIDVVPNSSPRRFRWKQTTDTINGTVTQTMEGGLSASAECAVSNLIAMVKLLQKENKDLWARVEKQQPISQPIHKRGK